MPRGSSRFGSFVKWTTAGYVGFATGRTALEVTTANYEFLQEYGQVVQLGVSSFAAGYTFGAAALATAMTWMALDVITKNQKPYRTQVLEEILGKLSTRPPDRVQ